MSIAITSLHECRAVLIPRILSHTVHRAAHFDPPVQGAVAGHDAALQPLGGRGKVAPHARARGKAIWNFAPCKAVLQQRRQLTYKLGGERMP